MILTEIKTRKKLVEMPISINYQRQNSKNDRTAFRPDDQKLMTTAKPLTKIHRLWQNSVCDVDLYLIDNDLTHMMQYQEDPVDDLEATRREKLDRALRASGMWEPDEFAKNWDIDLVAKPQNITVVLTQNEGAQRMPLTGWMVAHRLFHAIMEGTGNIWPKDKIGDRVNFNDDIKERPDYAKIHSQCSNLIKDLQDIFQRMMQVYGSYGPFGNNLMAQLIGPTKAARTDKLSNPGELIPEAFAQYMLMGKCTFNQLTGIEFKGREEEGKGNLHLHSLIQASSIHNLNGQIEQFARMCNFNFGNIIRLSKGKIFVL